MLDAAVTQALEGQGGYAHPGREPNRWAARETVTQLCRLRESLPQRLAQCVDALGRPRQTPDSSAYRYDGNDLHRLLGLETQRRVADPPRHNVQRIESRCREMLSALRARVALLPGAPPANVVQVSFAPARIEDIVRSLCNQLNAPDALKSRLAEVVCTRLDEPLAGMYAQLLAWLDDPALRSAPPAQPPVAVPLPQEREPAPPPASPMREARPDVPRSAPVRRDRESSLEAARGALWLHTSAGSIPTAVDEFVHTHWLEVLAQAYEQEGPDGRNWLRANEILADLVWSLRRKHGSARSDLVRQLPRLISSLNVGLERIGVAMEIRTRFFSELVSLHAAAIQAGMPASEQRAATVPPVDGQSGPSVEVRKDGRDSSTEAPTQKAEELARGTWLEFDEGEEGSRRLRLSWISPGRNMYVFTSREGLRALALTRREMDERLSSGRIRLAHCGPDGATLPPQLADDLSK